MGWLINVDHQFSPSGCSTYSPHFVYYPRHKCKIAGCIGRRSLSFFPVCAGCTSVQEANILNNHNVLGTSEFATHLLNEITLIFIDLRAC